MRLPHPLEHLPTIRAKLGSTIIFAVAVTLLLVYLILGFAFRVFEIRDSLWKLALAGAAAAAIALAMARWLARGMTQPLRDMARAAHRMETGDYSQRVHTISRDEVGQLAVAFNNMSTELESLERLRRDLVANVSHELKTPISALRAHLENLLDGVERPDPETLQIMLNQSERLTRLVDQLLDLSRIESGELRLNRTPVPLHSLVRRVLSEIEVARADRGVRVSDAVRDDLPPVLVDAERVHQVLYNLLDNALRYTPPGGQVTVEAYRTNGSCVVAVTDTGHGIAPEHLPWLFERFYRADAARARGDGGTGIGLAIARSVVEAHGGHVELGRGPSGGARFRFVLPAATPDFAD